ncbi:MAG TPA: potassium channel protein [Pyrinomonadaceae bacterium]|nr:potassium channel protein [Pyrinomonadaceae bacterium]
MGKFRIRDAIIAVLAVVVLGTISFHLIEGWSLLDSLYLTAQTVTTVGFGDLTPKTVAGRAFATVFMVIGAGVVLFALTSAVQSIVQSEIVAALGQRRRTRKMNSYKDHFIVCGAGRVGSHLIRDLRRVGATFVVLERDSASVAELISQGETAMVRDATLEESLREAGVLQARGLAACLPDDADNVYVVLTARDLNPNLHIVARAAEEQAEKKLLRAGANRVVAPTIIGGHRMAVALTKPAVDDFIDSITASQLDLTFEQVEVAAVSSLTNKELRETGIRPQLNIVIVAIKCADGQMLFNPSGEKKINAGDMLIAIGHPDSLVRLKLLAEGRD